MIYTPPPGHEPTIAAVAACGVPAANIRIAYEEEIQSDVVTIHDLGAPSDEKYRCVHRAVHPTYIVRIEDADQYQAYSAVVEREEQVHARAEAVDWLRGHHMLDRVPRYDPAGDLAAFARALETACGVATSSAIEAHGATTLTFRPGFLTTSMPAEASDALACLRRMLAASDAPDHGVRLGFLVSEAAH